MQQSGLPKAPGCSVSRIQFAQNPDKAISIADLQSKVAPELAARFTDALKHQWQGHKEMTEFHGVGAQDQPAATAKKSLYMGNARLLDGPRIALSVYHHHQDRKTNEKITNRVFGVFNPQGELLRLKYLETHGDQSEEIILLDKGMQVANKAENFKFRYMQWMAENPKEGANAAIRIAGALMTDMLQDAMPNVLLKIKKFWDNLFELIGRYATPEVM